MTTGMRAYAAVLADPAARAFSAAGFVARLPISMTGLGIVLLVSATTGSFGRAGLVTAVGTVVGAVAAPAWGRVIDRVGQAAVLLTAAVLNSVALTVLILSVRRGWPLAVSLVAAAVTGLGHTSAGSCVRARWTHRLRGTPLLNTGFAVEAVLDEVIFIAGPLLVTFLATSLHPVAGLATAAVIGLFGALLLAAQRSTEPPLHAGSSGELRAPMPMFRLVPIVVASAAIGSVFGGMEVGVVAFMTERDLVPYTGLLLTVWALGSLIAGVLAGSVRWRASPARRFRIGALALAGSLLPLPFIDHPVAFGAVLGISGLAIAPTMIASVAVVQSAVPASRFTEAMGWTTSGLAAGLAAGAAVVGQLIDRSGSPAGFWALAGSGVLLVATSLAVRSGTPEPADAESQPAADRAGGSAAR